MFTGQNELQLNEATMVAALNYWLTNKVLNPDEPAPKVSAVGYHSGNGTFLVTLSEPEPRT